MGGWQGQPAAVLTIGATFLGSKRREWARHALALEKKSRSPPPKSTYIGGHVAPGLLIVARKLGLVLLKSRAVPKAVWQAGAGGGEPKVGNWRAWMSVLWSSPTLGSWWPCLAKKQTKSWAQGPWAWLESLFPGCSGIWTMAKQQLGGRSCLLEFKLFIGPAICTYLDDKSLGCKWAMLCSWTISSNTLPPHAAPGPLRVALRMFYLNCGVKKKKSRS